ncbi:hypothetical protein ACOMHN_021243 [Nucella lapillus]
MAFSLSNVTAREMLHNTRERVKPWGDFLDTKRFQLPTSLPPLPRRVVQNIREFHGNYVFIFVGLFLFCVLTSPMLLVAIGICLGACYAINARGSEPLPVMGFPLSVGQQYMGVAGLSFPLFWLAGAGSAVFWIIGASFFFIMLHASTYTPDDDKVDGFDIQMDSIETM